MKLKLSIFAIIIFLINACMSNKVTITAANTTQPVLVGDVIGINKKTIDKSNLKRKSELSIPIENNYLLATSGYTTMKTTKREGSNKFDIKLAEMKQDSLSLYNLVKVKRLRYSVKMAYWLALFYSGVKAVLDVNLYQTPY